MRIGVFDSGLGGLTVLKSIQNSFKGGEIFYIADTFFAPYGTKSKDDILNRCKKITDYFLKNFQIDALIIACNTATSVAIKTLREEYQNLIIVGAEPALKPAIFATKSKKIGILATLATLKGEKYKALFEELIPKNNITLYEEPCIGLVEKIENGEIDTKSTQNMLKIWLEPMKKNGVDTIVLGCTHYPLIKDNIKSIIGEDTILIESSEAIAKRVDYLLDQKGHINEGKATIIIYHTNNINESMVKNILNNKNITIRKCEI